MSGERQGAERDTVLRPNGKAYRRRKPPVLTLASDQCSGGDIPLVLRTHDADEAKAILLAQYGADDFYIDLDHPMKRWARLGYQHGEPTWIDDPVRGMPVIEWDEPRRATRPIPPGSDEVAR